LSVGSVCGGGRYDNLAGFYTNTKLSGVGVSIGLTRLFYQLKDAGLLFKFSNSISKVLITQLDDSMLSDYIGLASNIRKNGVSCEVYFENSKLKKQFSYADKLGIPYVILFGEDEKKSGMYTLRNMLTGEQFSLDFDSLLLKLK